MPFWSYKSKLWDKLLPAAAIIFTGNVRVSNKFTNVCKYKNELKSEMQILGQRNTIKSRKNLWH
jgi:hypothetical protein